MRLRSFSLVAAASGLITVQLSAVPPVAVSAEEAREIAAPAESRFIGNEVTTAVGPTWVVQAVNPSPDTTYDMLDWMTLNQRLRASHHLYGANHPLFTVVWPDKIWFIKDSPGSPWDIALYDDEYIYDWITGADLLDPLSPCYTPDPWHDPRSFKKFSWDTNHPIVPRYAVAGFPGTRVLVTDSRYQTYRDCQWCRSQDLGKVFHELWGPYTIDLGGNLGVQQVLMTCPPAVARLGLEPPGES